MNENLEVSRIAELISMPAGFGVDLFAGMLGICRNENNAYVVYGADLDEELEFTDATAAAECFVELRRELECGYDFEVEVLRPSKDLN